MGDRKTEIQLQNPPTDIISSVKFCPSNQQVSFREFLFLISFFNNEKKNSF